MLAKNLGGGGEWKSAGKRNRDTANSQRENGNLWFGAGPGLVRYNPIPERQISTTSANMVWFHPEKIGVGSDNIWR